VSQVIDRREIKSHVDMHLAAARSSMLPRVRAAFDRLTCKHGLLADAIDPYFSVLGHPLFELPIWVAERLRSAEIHTSDQQLADVLGVSALGYLHVRAQDDWLDAASRQDPTLVGLAEALLVSCHRLLISAVGTSGRFWDFHTGVLNSYAESMLHTNELRTTDAKITRECFGQVLAQSRPMVIPSAALLDRANCWQLLPRLEEFIFAATAVTQLVNDLTDLYRDRRMGQRTWAIETVGDSGTDRPWHDVLEAMNGGGHGGFQKVIANSLHFHDRSAALAEGLGLAAAEGWLAERRTILMNLQGPLKEHLAAAFLQRIADESSLKPYG
jgi:hypothetical protein